MITPEKEEQLSKEFDKLLIHTRIDLTKYEIKTIFNFFLEHLKGEEREWISVSEKLPEEDQICLAIDIIEGIAPVYAIYQNKIFNRRVNFVEGDRIVKIYYPDITHWMPLPTKPSK